MQGPIPFAGKVTPLEDEVGFPYEGTVVGAHVDWAFLQQCKDASVEFRTGAGASEAWEGLPVSCAALCGLFLSLIHI